jgi:hypothetical protein
MATDRRASEAKRLLLAGLVDYAGLFPPAALSMAEAVRRYREYRKAPESWALGKFVVPVAQLAEFEEAAQPKPGQDPWPLAVIAGSDFGADLRIIEEFAGRVSPRVDVGAIEVRASSPEHVESIARDAATLRMNIVDDFDVYVEVPVAADPSPVIDAIAEHGLRAKVRTGGVEAGAFPTSEQLARFMAACTARGVTFKATAGLHHAMRGEYPLTYEPASARGTMFGFLNVFLAALFVREGLGAADAAALLEERDASAISFGATSITWRGRVIDAAAIRAARAATATSFGSCSFEEPVADLSSLGLL